MDMYILRNIRQCSLKSNIERIVVVALMSVLRCDKKHKQRPISFFFSYTLHRGALCEL